MRNSPGDVIVDPSTAYRSATRTCFTQPVCGPRMEPASSPISSRTRDATVVQKLREAGAVSIGKLNMHELAYGITRPIHITAPVRNPRDRDRIPGGSSGGSGAAVAAGILYWRHGSDTGGSIRIPASFCGTVGFKPTFGLVSTEGCFPLGASLDHMGPLARTVQDAAWLTEAMSGHSFPIKPQNRCPNRSAGELLFRRCRPGNPRGRRTSRSTSGEDGRDNRAHSGP